LGEDHMEGTMRQLQIVEPGRAEWREVPIPQPGEGQVLVKVLGVTTCPHWDLHLMDGVPMFPGRPLAYPYTPGQPGHEAMGEIAALGPGVDRLPLSVEGTSLTVGTCVSAWRDPGHHQPGCYGQYVCLAAEDVIEVPADLEPQAIAPLELAMCVQVSFDQLLQLDSLRGKRFGVSGLGPAGLVAVQMARAYGARQVVGIDPLPARRELAARLGADVVLAPGGEALPAGRSGADALDAAIDCTGLKVSIEFLMDRTRQAVAIFGVLRQDVTFGARHWSGLSLLGYGSHNRHAAERALALVKGGQLELSPLVTHSLPFSRYVQGVELLRAKKAIKICFLPWAED
jgi:threonine dehydrogenase-like Zn-dependent dehydrogenase